MADESFSDAETAAYLNAHFVSVKVDREERPDVDAVYMAAVQAATGQGGWPMTVFMTPDGEPFYFGTYFPPAPRHGLPSFRQVLEGVTAAWADRRGEVAQVAGRIVRELSGAGLAERLSQVPGEAELGAAVATLTEDFDEERGGFGGAPKFPPSMVLEFLLRHHARTGSGRALKLVRVTCEAMARGGIYDQLGGGFARYAVDAEWTVPHFEKMLYDNALLCRVYAHLWRSTGSPRARQVALETADFLLRELRTEEGGFASALDADSAPPEDSPWADRTGGRHQEGAYYAWTPEQLREVLGEEDAAFAAEYFGVSEDGTFEAGASVLRLATADGLGEEAWAGEPGRVDAAEPPSGGAPARDARVEAVRRRLLQARELRPRPGRDDKVVAAWNGLAIAALAEVGGYFERPDLVEAATAAAELLVRVHTDDQGRLARTSRDGTAGSSAGVLEDYADVAEGYLTLYAVSGQTRWLERAGGLLEVVLERFLAEDGTLFDTADDAERLFRRPQDPTDNAAPSGWTAATGALLSYAAYTGSPRHRQVAERALGVVSALAARAPRFIGWGLAVAEAALDGPREVAVIGSPGDPDTAALHRVALLATAPGAVVAVGPPSPEGDGSDAAGVPLLQGRPLLDGRPAAYVCRHFTCDAPTADPQVLQGMLR